MNKLEEKIKSYFRNKSEVIAVYLFGSHAVGKERPFSDIDVGILFDETDSALLLKRRNDYLVELGRLLRKDIHPVILNLAGEELLRQIFLKGKCILINDAKKLAKHKMVMFVKIAEFAYYKNQMQSGLIRKVMEG
ncbi:MAG: nucleotidyltransferase domain-containing protein [Deltaproteobacteria bacterium]|nr:nucleotidyltransferase domain-containing protein [Deltaproteobacteria bacterium]